MLDKLWDDVLAGPQPERGLGKLRKMSSSKPALTINSDLGDASSSSGVLTKSTSMPSTPTTPGTPNTPSPRGGKQNIWRSVFHPGSNLATRNIGADIFDKPQPNSPTVYDCKEWCCFSQAVQWGDQEHPPLKPPPPPPPHDTSFEQLLLLLDAFK